MNIRCHEITSIEELTDQTRSTAGEFSKDIEALTVFMAQKSPGEVQEKILEKLVQINKSAVKTYNLPLMDPVISEISKTANNHVISQKAGESMINGVNENFRRVISVNPREKQDKGKGLEGKRPHVSIEDCKEAVQSLNNGDGRKFMVAALELFDIARASEDNNTSLKATKLLSEINISVFDACDIPFMNPALNELSKVSGNKNIRRMADKNYIDGDDEGIRNVH